MTPRTGLAFLLSLSALSAAGTPALLILSKSDQTLSIVDGNTLKVGVRLPSGPDPHEVIASSDGHYAFISNYGGGAYNTISVIDLVAQKALPPVDLTPLRGAHGLDFSGGKLWFTAETNKVIGSLDPSTMKVDFILGTGQNRTHMVYVFPDGKRMVTTNVNAGTISIIDKTMAPQGRGPGGPPPGGRGPGPGGPGPGGRGPGGRGPGGPREDWDETVVKVGPGAEGFDVSPDGKELWTANAQDGTISIVDLPGRKLKETLQANVTGANRLKFTPDGKQVFVSTLGGPDLTVIDAASHKELKRLPIGRGAAGIQMQPDGVRAFVACTPDDYVVVVDLKTLHVTAKIDAGKQPDGMAWVPSK